MATVLSLTKKQAETLEFLLTSQLPLMENAPDMKLATFQMLAKLTKKKELPAPELNGVGEVINPIESTDAAETVKL